MKRLFLVLLVSLLCLVSYHSSKIDDDNSNTEICNDGMDNDGDADLIVVGEWMEILFYENAAEVEQLLSRTVSAFS